MHFELELVESGRVEGGGSSSEETAAGFSLTMGEGKKKMGVIWSNLTLFLLNDGVNTSFGCRDDMLV